MLKVYLQNMIEVTHAIWLLWSIFDFYNNNRKRNIIENQIDIFQPPEKKVLDLSSYDHQFKKIGNFEHLVRRNRIHRCTNRSRVPDQNFHFIKSYHSSVDNDYVCKLYTMVT